MTCISKKLSSFMAFLKASIITDIQCFWVIFGELLGRSWELSFNLVPLIIHKHMDKLKLLIGLWKLWLGAWWKRMFENGRACCLMLNLLTIIQQAKLLVVDLLKLFMGWILLTPFDLSPIHIHDHFSGEADERAKFIKKIHEQLRSTILKNTDKHRKKVVFQEGDLVWIH